MINFAFSSTQVDNSIMDTVKIWNSTPSRQQADEIADALRRGEIVILPTDSVYAITCDALNSKAIASLCRIKGINPEKTISPSYAAISQWLPNMPISTTVPTA